ncbi:MAG: hypothetical protein M3044_10495 [Thermoproteota archaeon]|nr:hypothetical protein [Thermoproteota archaeon]
MNSALAMENAALERVQTRVQQTILKEAKPLLQHHLRKQKNSKTDWVVGENQPRKSNLHNSTA